MAEKSIQEITNEMNEFVRSKGWYAENSTRQQTPRNIAISITLEAAELLEHFQWTDEVKDKEGLADEIADVTMYLMQLSWLCKIDIGKAIENKLAKNRVREWKDKL
jgi:NTP pyrophosphatase (non-canonical NTP hydrolase)